jgi:hypothetical protein
VFFSYSHEDENLRNDLEKHLTILKRQGIIETWHDRKISPGQHLGSEIDAHLNSANVILLLISSDFLASDYCYSIEAKRALERHQAGEATVIPIVLRSADWQETVFGKLAALPSDGNPVTSWPNQDEAFVDVAIGIKRAVECLLEHGIPLSGRDMQSAGDGTESSSGDAVSRERIDYLLNASHATLSPERNRELLDTALRLCESWITHGGTAEARLLRGAILAEIAIEQSVPAARGQRWRDAVSFVPSPDADTNGKLIDRYASLAVDCFQDSFSDLELAERLRVLRTARDVVTSALRYTASNRSYANLLARKSSLLRQIARIELSDRVRINLLEESLRCAVRATEQWKSPGTLLELAESHWAVARHQKTDEEYVARLRQAEECFQESRLNNFELADFALARFYRMTFRQLDCCAVFPQALIDVRNPRRLLRECPMYGEAAIQLWYNGYPAEIIRPHLLDARRLLEAAIAAGYGNARQITDLAFICAILEGPPAGDIALGVILDPRGSVDWARALEIASSTTQDDLLSQSFSLGIHLGSVWTLLGTYFMRFKKDDRFAGVMYRTAVRLDHHNPIALTNLARFLVRKGAPADYAEARRLLQTAEQFSDRRFRWWRSVLAELEEKGGVVPSATAKQPAIAPRARPLAPSHFANLKQLKKRFQSVEELSDVRQRGFELEALIFELARLTFATSAPSYRFQRTDHGSAQIDGYFEYRAEKYRVECKWQASKIDHVSVSEFIAKLDVAGVSGLLISMAGFSDSAIDRAREARSSRAVLLMDGDEIHAAMAGIINFDVLIQKKRLMFDQYSNPYHRVLRPEELAA